MNIYLSSKNIRLVLVCWFSIFFSASLLANSDKGATYQGRAIKDVDSLEGTVEHIDYIKGEMRIKDSVLVITKGMKVKSASKRSLSRYSVKKNQKVRVTYAYDKYKKSEIIDTVIILGK